MSKIEQKTLDLIKANPEVFIGCLYQHIDTCQQGADTIRAVGAAAPSTVAPLNVVADLLHGINDVLRQMVEATGVADPRSKSV